MRMRRNPQALDEAQYSQSVRWSKRREEATRKESDVSHQDPRGKIGEQAHSSKNLRTLLGPPTSLRSRVTVTCSIKSLLSIE